MQINIPTLHTERLALVPIAEAHLDLYAFLYGDPVVVEYIGPTMDREEAGKRMARQAGYWVLRGFGGWSVEVRETGELIGWTGIMFPEGNIAKEIGWMLHPASWGRGYATEAAEAALAYAFETVGAERVMARISPANAGSISVAHKLGMTLDTEMSDEETSYYFAHRGSVSEATSRCIGNPPEAGGASVPPPRSFGKASTGEGQTASAPADLEGV